MWNFFSVFFPLFVFLLLHQEAGWWIISENLWRSFQTVPQDQVWRNDSRQHLHAGMQKKKGIILLLILASGVDQEEMCRECTPSPSDHLWISYITSTVEKKEKKTSVIYWCWSKTWDKVKEFELNVKLPIWHGSFEY